MREAYRLMAKSGDVPSGIDWIFIARRAIAEKSVQDVIADIAVACKSISNRAKPHVR
jgi:hypothetical protein